MSFIPHLSSPVRTWPFTYLVATIALAPLLNGCTGVCGSLRWCEEGFPASRISVHEGGRWGRSRGVLTDADGLLRGEREDGAAWQLGASPDGQLVIGQPDAGAVVLVAPPLAGAGGEPLQVRARWTGREGDFGGAIASGRFRTQSQWSLWVGAPKGDGGRGEVYVFADADVAGGEPDSGADLVLTGASPGDRFGTTIHRCADLTGDGEAEWLITAPGYSSPTSGVLADEGIPSLAGAAFLLSSEALLDLEGTVDAREVATVWWGVESGARAAQAVACVDDLDGDGTADVVVGAPLTDGESASAGDDGVVYLISGHRSQQGGPLSEVAWRTLHGTDAEGWFGAAVATGDVDGDGVAELIVGAPGAQLGQGRVLLYRGVDLGGTAPLSAVTSFEPDPARGGADDLGADHLGSSIGIGDLNGDGIGDLFLGAPDWPHGSRLDVGRLFVWLGREDGWGVVEQAGDDLDQDHVVEGALPYQRVGRGLLMVDLDGDDDDEVILVTRSRTNQ